MNRRVATVFIDGLFLMLLILVLLPHKPASEENKRLGVLSVWATWAHNSKADVDLWLRTPRDSKAVGYSRLRGADASLLRDELGNSGFPTREEVIIDNAVVDGEYIVNLHLYRDGNGEAPIQVTVIVLFQHGASATRMIWRGDPILRETGQELTAVRFSIKNSDFVPTSVYYVFQPIRNAAE